MLLQLRMDTLWDYVDYFVISEATYTHKGLPRKTIFETDKFEKYKSKIRYQRLETRPPGENEFWKNENFILKRPQNKSNISNTASEQIGNF